MSRAPKALVALGHRIVAWVRWFGLARLGAAAASVVVVLGGGWWLLRPAPLPVEAGLPRAATATGPPPTVALAATATPSSPVTPAADVVVHVAGAVARPGVYRLPDGARVADAVARAGGPIDGADENAVNLAQRVVDGQRVLVPLVGQALQAAGAGGTAPAGPLDLNTASVDQLDGLPGIGPATAAAIVAHREQHGPFATVDELGDVRGIGQAKLDALRALVRT